jgi:hypothetical protein
MLEENRSLMQIERVRPQGGILKQKWYFMSSPQTRTSFLSKETVSYNAKKCTSPFLNVFLYRIKLRDLEEKKVALSATALKKSSYIMRVSNSRTSGTFLK